MSDQTSLLLFQPDPPPAGQEYVYQQFLRLAGVLEGMTVLQLRELHVEVEKPVEGMVVLADGTNWDPGSGAGFYGYRGGAWNLLG